MKKFLSALCAIALISCTCNVHLGNGKNGKTVTCKGPVITKTFDLADFNAIEINGQADMEFTQTSGSYGVSVEANEEVFQHLNYRVVNGKLILETINKVNIRADKYEIYISAPMLSSIEVNGAIDGKILSLNQPDKFELEVNGAADLELNKVSVPQFKIEINGAGDLDCKDLNVSALDIEVNGAGDVKLAGKAESCKLDVSGAGDIDARKLDCEQFETHKAGLASIKTK